MKSYMIFSEKIIGTENSEKDVWIATYEVW